MANDFLPFAEAAGARVVSQAVYAAAAWRVTGFITGVMDVTQINKVLRQSNYVGGAVAHYIIDEIGGSVLDDGNVDNFVTLFTNALVQQAIVAGKIPRPGTIVDWAGDAPPPGWLLTDGAVVSQVTYAGIYAEIGGTFNIGGEPAGYFRLPDKRGNLTVGNGGTAAGVLTAATRGGGWDALGDAGGEELHTVLEPENPSHVHPIVGSGQHSHSVPELGDNAGGPLAGGGHTPAGGYQPDGRQYDGSPGNVNAVDEPVVEPVSANIDTDPAGGGLPHNNVGLTIVLNCIIKE